VLNKLADLVEFTSKMFLGKVKEGVSKKVSAGLTAEPSRRSMNTLR
jgi:hypothetical protein